MITTATIKLWDYTVGVISWNQIKQIGNFEFDEKFTAKNLNIAPLKMPVSQAKNNIFNFTDLAKNTTFKGLPGLLADVLPDKYGNTLINVWLARHSRVANSLNPVEVLCFIGTRGMGALEFEPANPISQKVANSIEINQLVDIAKNILNGRQDFKTQMQKNDEKALVDILKIGTSAGGARAKAVIAFNPETKEVKSGQTNAPKGFTHWLIKFDGIQDDQFGVSKGYGRVEMAYYLMAKDCGIEMMESRLLEENDRAHFMTRRFDREPVEGKIHIQSFCAIQHYDFNDVGLYSYEQLFETMRALRLPFNEAEQVFKRMVFNVLAKNCDDHTKNFAFMMNKQGKWSITPAYDICYAYRPQSPWVSQQSLSINGKRIGINREDLMTVAQNISLKKGKQIINQIKEVILNFKFYAKQTGIDAQLSNTILKTIKDDMIE